ncbi:oxidoreductase-like protein [Xylariaceae sp. FL1019]|nr:oxidoreductase-like protein [Xylariaceae sp. FL1019]
MPPSMRPFLRAARLSTPVSRCAQFQRSYAVASDSKLPGGTPGEAKASEQAAPIGPYYEAILITPQPIPEVKPEEPPASSPKSTKNPATKKKAAAASSGKDSGTTPSPSSSSSPAQSSPSSKDPSPSTTTGSEPTFSVSSRLAGPLERADRLQALRDRSTLIAGIRVPPKPDEPDNCCMSGCVDCVWERYRDEMEDWASKTALAEAALQRGRAQGPVDVLGSKSAVKGLPVSGTMDEDGGGSETNWSLEDIKKNERPRLAKDFWDDQLYKNVDVGIREFMKNEKRLKQKHAKENAA